MATSVTPLPPGSTIGMLGGGQLGRMAAFVAKRLGYRLITLDPTADGPCGQVSDDQIVTVYDDEAALDRLAEQCDVITYEFENVPATSVARLKRAGVPVYPDEIALAAAQHRVREKKFAKKAGLRTTPFAPVTSLAEAQTAVKQLGLPGLLKTCSGGYDGKGQRWVNSPDEVEAIFTSFNSSDLIYERAVDFQVELSVICARSQSGQVVTYPPAENIHVNNVLDCSIVPARVSARVQAKAQEMAQQLARALDLVGVIGVEMFMLPDGKLLFNEFSPRPHNSGHYTIEACICSQFEQQIRAICGLPLGDSNLRGRAAVMVNLLGNGRGDKLHGLEQVLAQPQAYFHLYGKQQAKAGRKMGHLTVLGSEIELVLARAQKLRAKLQWEWE